MLKVICNTTPIISLLKISKLHLLKDIYGRVIIPEGVYNEIECGKNTPYYTDLKGIDWIEIKQVKNTDAVKNLIDLDKGEAEVIVLAEELSADLVIIDEKIGRDYATRLGLKLTGTLGILVKAKEKGLIKSVRPLLDEMKEKGIWLGDKDYKIILTLSDES